MLGCAVCGAIGPSPLCGRCRPTLDRGRRFLTGGGLLVSAAFAHHGAGRILVHRLKYQAMPIAAEVLAEGMAAGVPDGATALVPVPRARLRRWRHGIDPAWWLAAAVGRHTGLPVVPALTAGWWWRRHAGRGDEARSPVGIRARGRGDPGWTLVDDVATSGATLDAAAEVLGGGVRLGLVATSPSNIRVARPTTASTSREVA